MPILVVGMATCDIIFKNVSSEIMKKDKCSVNAPTITTGGDALNVTKVLSILGERPTIITSVGRDIYSEIILSALDKYNLSKELVKESKCHTAVSYVLLDPNGERHFITVDGIFNDMFLTDKEFGMIKDYNYLYFGSALTMEKMDKMYLEEMMRKAKNHNLITFMDAAVNYELSFEQLESVLCSLKYVDYFLPSIEEVKILTNTDDLTVAQKVFSKYGCPNVIVKSGSKGAYILTKDEIINVPAKHVKKVVDTTGAGDSFVAGFIKSIKDGDDIYTACKHGNYIASKVVQTYGVDIKI